MWVCVVGFLKKTCVFSTFNIEAGRIQTLLPSFSISECESAPDCPSTEPQGHWRSVPCMSHSLSWAGTVRAENSHRQRLFLLNLVCLPGIGFKIKISRFSDAKKNEYI